ncbi:MAG: hypothetical protein V1494_00670 [Candidatus Diapherotrites archaeon]
MVCTKLDSGCCMLSNESCDKPYEMKMISFQSCPVFKSGGKGLSLHAENIKHAVRKNVNKLFASKQSSQQKPVKKGSAKISAKKVKSKKSGVKAKSSKSSGKGKAKSKAKKKKR